MPVTFFGRKFGKERRGEGEEGEKKREKERKEVKKKERETLNHYSSFGLEWELVTCSAHPQ
jgi:hypothetical protein